MCHLSEYSCAHPTHHVSRGAWHHSWGCCAPSWTPGRIPTREEIIEELEEYLKQLRAETKGVEERIAELRKEG